MESFIYEDLNRACREKDESMIQYYGAFAAALSYIIYHANENRTDEDKINKKKGNNCMTTLYRGLKIEKELLDS